MAGHTIGTIAVVGRKIVNIVLQQRAIAVISYITLRRALAL
jgi:hypothetical protein